MYIFLHSLTPVQNVPISDTGAANMSEGEDSSLLQRLATAKQTADRKYNRLPCFVRSCLIPAAALVAGTAAVAGGAAYAVRVFVLVRSIVSVPI